MSQSIINTEDNSSPPPYDQIAMQLKTTKINKQSLRNISAEYDSKITHIFKDQLMNLLRQSIIQKRIRIMIGFYILPLIDKPFLIESNSDSISYDNTKFFSGTTIVVLVKHESIKKTLEKPYEDIKKKLNICNVGGICTMTLKTVSFKYEHIKSSEPTIDVTSLWLRYENVSEYLPEFLEDYDDVYKTIFDETVLSNINETLVKCATEGIKSYVYKSNDAEFIYEYIKHHHVFDDIDIDIDVGKIIFSW
jgi:hypothetical protein